MHYCQPFNMESAALVERLLNDLVKTTDSYHQVKNDFNLVKNENKLN